VVTSTNWDSQAVPLAVALLGAEGNDALEMTTVRTHRTRFIIAPLGLLVSITAFGVTSIAPGQQGVASGAGVVPEIGERPVRTQEGVLVASHQASPRRVIMYF